MAEQVVNDFSKMDPEAFLKHHTSCLPSISWSLNKLNEFYRDNTSAVPCTNTQQLSVLDLGCGPTLTHAIIAAPFASEIVMADIAQPCLDNIKKWLDNDKEAHDWSETMSYLLTNVEGKDVSDVPAREALLRDVIKAVTYCDITQDPVITDPLYMKEYDIVQTFLCLESAATSKEQYVSILKRVRGLVKPGGKLVCCMINRAEKDPNDSTNHFAGYRIGNEKFYDLSLTEESAMQSLTEAGFEVTKKFLKQEMALAVAQMPNTSTTLVIATRPQSGAAPHP